jgi:hypothetical protein
MLNKFLFFSSVDNFIFFSFLLFLLLKSKKNPTLPENVDWVLIDLQQKRRKMRKEGKIRVRGIRKKGHSQLVEF